MTKKIRDHVSDLTSKIGNDISAMVKKGEDTLTEFVDAIAVLIITTCVVPIIVILIFAWIIKILFGFDLVGASTNFRKKISERHKRQ